MTYLFLWRTGQVRQTSHHPTVADVTAVKAGLLDVFKYADGHFLRLRINEEALEWVPVGKAKLLCANDQGLTHP